MTWRDLQCVAMTAAALSVACSSPEVAHHSIGDGVSGADGSVAGDASVPMGSGGKAAAGAGGASGSNPTGTGGTSVSGTGGTSVGGAATLADIYARASVFIGSCLEDDGINRNNSYLWYSASIASVWGRFGSIAQCFAARGGGCAAVVECTGWEWAPASDGCTEGCSGSTFVHCGGPYDFKADCSKLGLACDPNAVCSDGPSVPCDPATYVDTCESGSMPVYCDRDVVFRGPDCAALGLACAGGQCVGTGAACNAGNTPSAGDVVYHGLSCDGGFLTACINGHEHRLDCASIAPGFSCQTFNGVSFCGIAAECVPAEPGSGAGSRGTCDGNTIAFCNAGRVERIDCTSLGFERCDVTNGYGCVPNFAQP